MTWNLSVYCFSWLRQETLLLFHIYLNNGKRWKLGFETVRQTMVGMSHWEEEMGVFNETVFYASLRNQKTWNLPTIGFKFPPPTPILPDGFLVKAATSFHHLHPHLLSSVALPHLSPLSFRIFKGSWIPDSSILSLSSNKASASPQTDNHLSSKIYKEIRGL